ncbi:helicase/uvrB [Fadolivirus algeromassiliense]|jgi:hypothetical protein|uniref:Helicase/uvrB n=1 Tax=Fadolivirus FV1/VV64 TaxID=3070911 RepID=A0A7D3V5R8_9VIRU|nr:helicase/uvrB [Fadolivirus algeromassiliense]QKF94375.1 helicase/uvrB [Fadolivirus FV1/VV64]
MTTKLWQIVLSNSKKSFNAKKDDNGKLYNTIANMGLKKNGIALRARDGEYTDFTVMVLEDVKPLLTDHRISKAIKFLEDNDIQSCIRVLNIDNEVIEYGTNIIYSILKLWLEKNEINVPQEYKDKTIDINEKIKKWINTTRSDPLDVKIKIVNIGKSKKGHSVVPDDWLGKEFNNAVELHSAMDSLDWRKGKPPVNYCCIYSMMIKELYTWKDKSDNDIINFNPEFAIMVSLNGSNIINFNNNYIEWLNTLDDNIRLLISHDKNQSRYIIASKLNEIIRKDNEYIETDNVGYLVSKLQKCIRRGRKCSKLLYSTVNQLSKAKPYNLPEQQFVRVTGTRQLCWRLFITIMEDVEPYQDSDTNEYYGLLDILGFAILCHNDSNIQFNDLIINKLAYTALLIQSNDTLNHNWDWRKGKEETSLEFNNNNDYIKLAIKCMPMMSGDNRLLRKSIDYIIKFKQQQLNVFPLETLLGFSDHDYELECKYVSNDMHCNPNLLLYLQASLPFIPYNIDNHSTYGLSSFIWENSSKYNVRNGKLKKLSNENDLILKSLIEIQKNEDIDMDNNVINAFSNQNEVLLQNNQQISDLESRIGFLLLFGKKIRLAAEGKNKSIEVIVCGDDSMPCKIKRGDKYLEGEERYNGECRYVKYLNDNNLTIKLPVPPEGCGWNIKDKKVKLNAKIISTDKNNSSNEIEFYINDIKLKPFNTKNILIKKSLTVENEIPNCIENIIKQCLYNLDKDKIGEWKLNKIMRNIWKIRYDNKHYDTYKWKQFNKLDSKIWKCVYAKFYNNYNDEIMIGPVDRSGNKLHDSISYQYEGTILRIMNMLSMLYPNAITIKTNLKFNVNKNVNQYNNLINVIRELALTQNNNINADYIYPTIKTKLWDHQEKSSNQIFENIINKHTRGHGDASNVGSGKTLTALNVISKLAKYNSDNQINNYKGFLVLLPTTQLYKTWRDEINKHTDNFDVIEQLANGKLSKNDINTNSIIITTLGRNRDHPISNSWTLVVIDECLSVQNKEAFQTEEAFKQILGSQYGVVMMSATFFRSRFDKLFYMIKMLRSGLPEEKDYLDTILNECIICNISESERKWNTDINRFKLDTQLRIEYDKILKQDISSEQMYIRLSKLLYDKFNYVDCFKQVIDGIELKNRRALIYAKSKEEADEIAKIKNVTRYPDKNGKHTVLSYVEGTYGLNDLVIYDTIITRPPNPDALPQMRGRLDRNGNKNNILYIEYVIAENTIDEAGLLRLELCNNFYTSYILPLADFYELAVGKKKLNDIKSNHITLNSSKMFKLAKKSNVIIIDDDSIALSEQSTTEKKQTKINTMIKLVKEQRYYNIVVYNENLIEIDRMRNDLKNSKNIISI